MIKRIQRSFRFLVCWIASCVFLLSPRVYGRDDDELTELEEFIAEETAVEAGGSMQPTSRPVDSVFGAMDIMDIPRSVTVLTPEAMKQFNITDYHDLDKVGAGTQRINFYGLPGTPWMRGDIAGSFFNGMLRAYNRNDMPVSFGALEAMDIVKGPAPAHFSPTQAGGYVNQLPKSPYFDEFRGSMKVEVGTYDHYNIQGDIGGPFLLGSKPSAFRISATGQWAGSYYENLRNDFVSFYASMKVKLRDDVSLFIGGEYFNFKSNENAGWNRITQDLIDHGDYIIGEPEDGTSPLWDHTFPKSDSPYVVFRGPPSDHSITPNAFGANPALVVPFETVESAGLSTDALSLLENVPDQGYRYTLDYLNHPESIIFTSKIEGSTVLADPNDFADSEDLLFFFNYKNSVNPNRILKNQFLLESLTTDKLSSYGYAFAIRQLVIENKLTLETNFGTHTHLVIGGSVRFLNGKQLQDFDTEPFARRDITGDEISSNSIIKVGPQRQFQEDDAGLGCSPEGCNLWATVVSANANSKMFQFGVFSYMTNDISDRISVTTSVRGEFADWESGIPDEVERNLRRGEILNDSDALNLMASIGPVIRISSGITLYGSAQIGTAFEPTQGGAVSAGNEEDNFSRSELYEGGLKFHILNDTLFATAAGYYWDKSRFDARTGTISPLRSKGVEFELTWTPNDRLSLIASAGASRTHRRTPAGFRFADTDDGFWLPLVAGGLFAGGSQGRPDNNPELILNGFPEVSANVFLRYRLPNGLGFGIGARWRDTYFHNFDRTLVIPSAVILRGNISYSTERWDVLLTVENFTSEDWFLGSDPIFAANSLLLKAPAATGKLAFTYKF